MYIDIKESYPIKRLSPICQQLANQIPRIKLFPFFHDLLIYQAHSDFCWLPIKGRGLFVAAVVPSFAHEIAHTVEINPKRIIFPDWKIALSSNTILWTNNRFFTALQREITVRSIEQYIEPGVSKPDAHHVRIFNNQSWNAELRKRLPWEGRFRSYDDVLEWGYEIRRQTMTDWNTDRVIHEWGKRAEIINHWVDERPVNLHSAPDYVDAIIQER